MTEIDIHLSCPRCGQRHEASKLARLCSCGSPLLVEYGIDTIRRTVSPGDLRGRAPDMWRYRELLPVRDPANVVTLGEGGTPLVPADELGRGLGLPHLWLKDEGRNPTGTFKDRGASCGASRARELGIREVALATEGNAGASWACYGAAGSIRVHVAMPSDALAVNRLGCLAWGADVTEVDGTIADAGALIAERVREHGWVDVSTLKEPYRIEGKKTLGLEIVEQLDWTFPDVIIYPAGGGVGLIGIWRAVRMLEALGWATGDLPRLVIVQAEGCAPLIRAFVEGHQVSSEWDDPHTIASGLRVPKAFGDFLVLRAIRETGGTAVAVADSEIVRAMGLVARTTGILAAPEGAATVAAAGMLRERGDLSPSDRVVVLNTGSGMKYPEVLQAVDRMGRGSRTPPSSGRG